MPRGRRWIVRAALCPLLATFGGCITGSLWATDAPSERIERIVVTGESIAAPGLQRIAVRLDSSQLYELRRVMPFLGHEPTTLVIESVDAGALERSLHLAIDAGGGLTASCEIHVTRDRLDECDCTFELYDAAARHAWMSTAPERVPGLGGAQAVRMRCRLTMSPAVAVPAEAPVTMITVSARESSERGLPVALRVLLTPITVVLDVVLLPIEAVALLYMNAKMY